MANITAYLQAIMQAVYGEDVRGSIHDAIELINEVGEVVRNWLIETQGQKPF